MKIKLFKPKSLIIAATSIFLFQACKKTATENSPAEKITNTLSQTQFLQTDAFTKNEVNENKIFFAKVLARAVKEDESLRLFIKTEALKTFNKDYDILYEVVKHNTLSNGETFEDKLLKNTEDKDRIRTIGNTIPLLTILVPILPSGFSAITWNSSKEIPVVSTGQVIDKQVPFYNGTDAPLYIPFDAIPGFPTLVVKENERVRVRNSSARQTNAKLTSSAFKNSSIPYEFLDENFNNEIKSEKGVVINNIPDIQAKDAPAQFYISGVRANNLYLLNAYELMQGGWQRDNIYYGLTPTVTSGDYKPNVREYLYAMRFRSSLGFNKISDGDGDPTAPDQSFGTQPPWVEGFFEFQFDVVLNSTIGLGPVVTRYFPATVEDLFVIDYTVSHLPTLIQYYTVTSITPKVFFPNVELAPWNVQNTSLAWKLIISEIDPSQTMTVSNTHTSVYAGNFNFETKIGLKFGVSATITNSQTYTTVTQAGSDQLGDATLFFSDPIIKSFPFPFTQGGVAEVNSIPVGGWLDIAVIPKTP